jgi:polyhydroxybutyrate depolymerase
MMRRAAWTLLLVSVLGAGGCHFDGIAGGAGGWTPGLATHDVVVGDLTRQYLMHVPSKRPTTSAGTIRSYSLVIVLHGSSGSSDEIRQTTGMDSLSEVGRFLVAYPQGVQGAGGLFPSDWNAGTCCGAAARENIDDVGFITALIADVGKNLALDKRRIYVAGFSDGGRMAHHLGCKLAPTIAAIAVVSGSLKDDSCAPARPMPVLAVHGTSDTEVPFDDPALTDPPTPLFGVATTLPPSIQFWISADGCGSGTQDQPAADVVRTSFAACTGAEVVFYTIQGGSHAWPGDPGGAGSQPPMSEVLASQVITQFFARQVRR